MKSKWVVFWSVTGILVMSALILLPVQAQETCTRLSIYFEASENTVLDGKLSVGWEQTGGGKYGFADFWLDEEEVSGGKAFRIGAFNVTDVESFRTFLNDAELDIDGDGEFSTRRSDCSSPLPSDDGRLNLDDPASLAIIYTNSKTGGYDIYLVNPATGSGDLVIRVSRADVDAARTAAMAPDGRNTLIAEGETVTLWALTSGECQRTSFYPDGKPDVFIFDCAPASG